MRVSGRQAAWPMNEALAPCQSMCSAMCTVQRVCTPQGSGLGRVVAGFERPLLRTADDKFIWYVESGEVGLEANALRSPLLQQRRHAHCDRPIPLDVRHQLAHRDASVDDILLSARARRMSAPVARGGTVLCACIADCAPPSADMQRVRVRMQAMCTSRAHHEEDVPSLETL